MGPVLGGVSAYDLPGTTGTPIGPDVDEAIFYFHTDSFRGLRDAIQEQHAATCHDDPWHYSGGTEIVSSFVTFSGAPDWTTLRTDVLANEATALSEAAHRYVRSDDETLFPYDPDDVPVPYKKGALKRVLRKQAAAVGVSASGRTVSDFLADIIGIGA